MPRFKEQAICLRVFDWSETSQVVVLLTEGRGLLRGLAKGAKRTSPSSVARYSGGIELLTLGQAVGTIKPSAELATITEGDLQQPFAYLRRDLKAQHLSMYAAELTGAMLAELDPHPRVFAGLLALFEALADPARRGAAMLAYQWRLLDDCGYRPDLGRDVKAEAPWGKQASYTFDARGGGLTAAAVNHPDAWRVRRATVELLRAVASGAEPEGDAESFLRANRLLCVYLRSLLGRELHTAGVVLGKKR